MRSGFRMLGVAAVLTLMLGSPTPARAQQGRPMGQTTVSGASDSLFAEFVHYLRAHGDSVLASDRANRTVRAHVPHDDEPVVFVFTAHGDSTTIAAQGERGGMRALIMGLGVVNEWLHGTRSPPSDSATPTSPAPPATDTAGAGSVRSAAMRESPPPPRLVVAE